MGNDNVLRRLYLNNNNIAQEGFEAFCGESAALSINHVEFRGCGLSGELPDGCAEKISFIVDDGSEDA
eukprot:NODE_7918_length_252_cov_153.655172_g7303_i0.p1 GENE.NODE_7918_length_252_cov_153.655172_g7303_i0~~NODE_7918_length_252_cov_153.655172_g7303_i0.p1  ORF type:complete len:68 (-),score=2.15 NODE_7918_length_252_cov_153.655172_g7303_i0:17-220(-)